MMDGWRRRFGVLAVAGVPAFCGWPLGHFAGLLFPGITVGWLAYLVLVHVLVRWTCGGRRYADIVAVAALIATPVVYGGAAVASVWNLVTGGGGPAAALAGAHYLRLCVTMLTVVPLALALVIQVPFQRIEHQLLEGRRGVSRREKALLMSLRVFNHIVYFVIPNILEVMREEHRGGGGPSVRAGRWRHLMRDLVHLAVEAICAAVRYIPLWAVEIAALPEPECPSPPAEPSRPADGER